MEKKPVIDSGLSRQVEGRLTRSIRRDGQFNVRRVGRTRQAFHPWLAVVNMSWPGFVALVGGVYALVNISFALLYFLLGPDAVQGSAAATEGHRFLNDCFFSGHTLTTVGYGNLAPVGVVANVTATIEALVGLLAFSVITGLLVTRASRPSARVEFSRSALVAPYEGGTALMFRVANQRSNNLMELEARVLMVKVVPKDGRSSREVDYLALEMDKVEMFPLTWTVVHPITPESPMWGLDALTLEALQVEFIVMLRGFDDTFSQVVHTRFSYRTEELVWDAKFFPAFHVAPDGGYILDLDRVSNFEKL